jgi:hypothetical protein
MKKATLILAVVLFVTCNFNLNAQNKSKKSIEQKKKCQQKGEKIFIKYAIECLEIMAAEAQKTSAKGVATISFIPGEETESWISRMKVVGNLTNEKHNFLAIAGSKAAEMASTYVDSGSRTREPLTGEFGFKGGVIKKLKCGYLVASFSGAPSEIDAKISKAGAEFLASKM